MRNRTGIINDYSFAKFHQRDVSNWIQNKSKDNPFVNVIPKRDHLQSMSQHCPTFTAEIHKVQLSINVNLMISLAYFFIIIRHCCYSPHSYKIVSQTQINKIHVFFEFANDHDA